MTEAEFSVIVPVYNSSEYLQRLSTEVANTFVALNKTCELVFVNDCSPDNSLEVMKNLTVPDNFRLVIINLKKNVGQYAATIVGLNQAKGEFVFTIDADFSPVENNFKILLENVSSETELVYGELKNPHENTFRKFGSLLFNWLVKSSLSKAGTGSGSSFRLITRNLLDKVLPQIYEPLMLDIYLVNAAVEVRFIPLQLNTHDKSTYSFFKLISQGVNLMGGIVFEKAFFSEKFNQHHLNLILSIENKTSAVPMADNKIESKTVYSVQIKTLEGTPFSFDNYGGKKILIVNVASACGFTPHYEGLQKLYSEHNDKVVVIGVPCNDFGRQEPGTPEEIRGFCEAMYGITFPITEKVNIRTEPVHPLYQFLTKKELNGFANSKVEWNFQKYLLNQKGELTHCFMPDIKPDDAGLLKAVFE